VLRQGSAILIAILLAKSSLGTVGIGLYEMLLYIGFVLTFFWLSGLMQGFLARYPQLPPGQQPAFLFNAYLVFLALSTMAAAALWWGQGILLPALAGQASLPHYGLFVVFLWLNTPTYLVEHIYLLLDRPAAIFRFGLFAFGVQFAATLLPIFLGYGLDGAFYALIGLALAKHLWLLRLLGQHSVSRLEVQELRRWLYLSFPLVLYALVGALSQSFDNWLVNFTFKGDEHIFAVFRYGARELPLVLALSNAFGLAMLPEVAGSLKAALWAMRDKSRKLFHLLFPLSILLVLTSKGLFPLVFSPDFQESALLFNIFLLVTISRLVFSRTILVGLNANRVVFYISLLELVFHLALGFALAPWLVLAGIALATVAAHTLEKILLCWYLYRRFGIGIGQYTDMRWYLGYSISLALAFVLALGL
jgi:O-antigen/teichoic acid export membrane protein